MKKTKIEETPEQMLENLRTLVAEAEAFVKESAGNAGDIASDELDKLKKIASDTMDRIKDGAEAAEETVKNHPYGTVGVCLLAGVLIGILINRR